MSLFRVSADEEGIRLLAFLRKHYPNNPTVKSLKRAIEAKLCKVNGQIERFSTRVLKAGDRVTCTLAAASQLPQTISILYEDEELLICDKPPGVVSDEKIFNRAFPKYCGALQLVHRLDKETSGVLILAKTEAIKEKMNALFEKRQIEKAYLALVDGVVKKNEGIIESYLEKKHAYQGQTIYGSSSARKGKKAITHWKCLKKGSQCSLLLCQPQTGRTHQLRVHLSEMGHPILGDCQYGKKSKLNISTRHLLHAYSLAFIHPTSHVKITVKAPIPQDIKEHLA